MSKKNRPEVKKQRRMARELRHMTSDAIIMGQNARNFGAGMVALARMQTQARR